MTAAAPAVLVSGGIVYAVADKNFDKICKEYRASEDFAGFEQRATQDIEERLSDLEDFKLDLEEEKTHGSFDVAKVKGMQVEYEQKKKEYEELQEYYNSNDYVVDVVSTYTDPKSEVAKAIQDSTHQREVGDNMMLLGGIFTGLEIFAARLFMV